MDENAENLNYWRDKLRKCKAQRDAVQTRLDNAIRWLRRLEGEYPGCLNQDAIEKHLESRE